MSRPIYEIVQEIMDERELTVAEIARLCDLPDSTVRGIMTRKQKSVALEVAFKMSDGLGVSLNYLNGKTDKKIFSISAEAETEEEEKLIDDFSLQLQDALIYLGLIGEGQDLTPTQFTILKSVFQIVAAAFGKENDHFEKFVVSFLNDRAG